MILPTAHTVVLKPETLLAFESYIRDAEASMENQLRHNDALLWPDRDLELPKLLQQGKIPARLWSGNAPVPVPRGLIHDWAGAVLVPGASLRATLGVIQDYDHHKDFFQPDVLDSRLISRQGPDFRIYLRLLKKKIISVVLDTEHAVHYSPMKLLLVLFAHHQNRRSRRCGDAEGNGAARRRRLWIPVAAGFVLEVSGQQGGHGDYVPGNFADARYSLGAEIDCAAAGAQLAKGVVGECPVLHSPGTYGEAVSHAPPARLSPQSCAVLPATFPGREGFSSRSKAGVYRICIRARLRRSRRQLRTRLYRLRKKSVLYQGTTSVVP